MFLNSVFYLAIVATLFGCDRQTPRAYRVTGGSADARSWVRSSMAELNDRLGCVYVREERSQQEIRLASDDEDRAKLVEDNGVGEFQPDTGDIVLTDYAVHPYLFGDVRVGPSDEILTPQANLSQQATERLFLHELGHAFGLEHSLNYGDIMWANATNFAAPISDVVWGEYLARLRSVGVLCAESVMTVRDPQ